MKLNKTALAVSLIAGASFANANDIKYGLQLGYANGGDTINEDLDSEAGDGMLTGIYALVPIFTEEFYIKVAANYIKTDDSFKDTSNDYNSELSRMPIDLLLVKKIENIQLAAGMTYHINTKYKTIDKMDIEGNRTTNAKNSFGLILEANYQAYSNNVIAAGLGLRYTNIDYKFKDEYSTKFDGSSIAFTANLSF